MWSLTPEIKKPELHHEDYKVHRYLKKTVCTSSWPQPNFYSICQALVREIQGLKNKKYPTSSPAIQSCINSHEPKAVSLVGEEQWNSFSNEERRGFIILLLRQVCSWGYHDDENVVIWDAILRPFLVCPKLLRPQVTSDYELAMYSRDAAILRLETTSPEEIRLVPFLFIHLFYSPFDSLLRLVMYLL